MSEADSSQECGEISDILLLTSRQVGIRNIGKQQKPRLIYVVFGKRKIISSVKWHSIMIYMMLQNAGEKRCRINDLYFTCLRFQM